MSLLRTAVSAAREVERAPHFPAIVPRPRTDVRPLWPPSSTHADESSLRVRAAAATGQAGTAEVGADRRGNQVPNWRSPVNAN